MTREKCYHFLLPGFRYNVHPTPPYFHHNPIPHWSHILQANHWNKIMKSSSTTQGLGNNKLPHFFKQKVHPLIVATPKVPSATFLWLALLTKTSIMQRLQQWLQLPHSFMPDSIICNHMHSHVIFALVIYQKDKLHSTSPRSPHAITILLIRYWT